MNTPHKQCLNLLILPPPPPSITSAAQPGARKTPACPETPLLNFLFTALKRRNQGEEAAFDWAADRLRHFVHFPALCESTKPGDSVSAQWRRPAWRSASTAPAENTNKAEPMERNGVGVEAFDHRAVRNHVCVARRLDPGSAPVSTSHPTPPYLFPPASSNNPRLAPLRSLSARPLGHPHNCVEELELTGCGVNTPSPLSPVCLSPRPLQDYSGLLLAPPAEAEELVSGAASLGKELFAAGLQLAVALGQVGIGPPQQFHLGCVYGVIPWQVPNKVLELLWKGKERE